MHATAVINCAAIVNTVVVEHPLNTSRFSVVLSLNILLQKLFQYYLEACSYERRCFVVTSSLHNFECCCLTARERGSDMAGSNCVSL